MIKAKQKGSAKTVNFPEKLFYKIGEVGRITGVEPYVLRYWESEFPFLKPRKSRSGQRLYVKKDIELILEIKRLLYYERYTIEGVKKRFSESTIQIVKQDKTDEKPALQETLSRVRSRLREIISQLS
ncbi:HTH-type transcriptional repressor YcgE [bacterium BMS3Bbin06]|nr:HTH-type transcriptional repressor YcgE [bacterium BMS3Abin08]GBE34205.1 HTH-type transcriptional repressor YcgE [bacterium BMS3Bbin06]